MCPRADGKDKTFFIPLIQCVLIHNIIIGLSSKSPEGQATRTRRRRTATTGNQNTARVRLREDVPSFCCTEHCTDCETEALRRHHVGSLTSVSKYCSSCAPPRPPLPLLPCRLVYILKFEWNLKRFPRTIHNPSTVLYERCHTRKIVSVLVWEDGGWLAAGPSVACLISGWMDHMLEVLKTTLVNDE